MKHWFVGVVLLVVSACSQSSHGPVGPQGPAGVAGAVGAKGDRGEKGEKGDTGTQGVPGVEGAPGATGAAGAPGLDGLPGASGFSPVVSVLDGGCVEISSADGGTATVCNGAPGATGATGERGPIGNTGLTGLQGPAGPLVFSFSGTSGGGFITNNSPGTATCWPVGGGAPQSAPIVALPVVLGTLLVPAGSSCSSILFSGALTSVSPTSPMEVQLAVYKNATRLGGGGAYSFLPLCTFSTSELCTNTATVDVTANDQLALCFVSSSMPHPVQPRVAWSVRCLAP